MAVSAVISESTPACLVLIVFITLSCDATNVQIETADGSRHVFEMKTMEKSGSYLLCANCKSFSTGPIPTPSALRFNVRFTPTGEVVNACETHRKELPQGLCSLQSQGSDYNGSCPSDGVCQGAAAQEEVADEIVRRNLLPFPSGDQEIDHHVAHAIVEMNNGLWDKAITMLTNILDKYPENVAAHYARGVAYARKGLESQQLALQAIADFTVCVDKEPSYPEGFERRAEVYITMNRFKEARSDLKAALSLRPNNRIRFSSGIVNLFLENFVEAEAEFRKNLDDESGDRGPIYIFSYFHLGLAQYYRGRLRNSIEVFKEVLKLQPNHVEACISLAQAFRELGNLRAAHSRFDQALTMSPNHTLSLQLKGSLLYHAGDLSSAHSVLQQCLRVDPENTSCQYLLALSKVALGQFYHGVKLATKVMIKSLPDLKISPERVRAQYVREYARYIHANLESSQTFFQPEVDLDEKMRVTWVQGMPLTLRGQGVYREQPGLQPEIPDILFDSKEDWPQSSARTLLCYAEKVGLSMQVSADGFLPNRRLNLAMGLAAIHIAQHAEAKWKNLKGPGKSTERPYTWKELFSIAVRYRQLVDPEQPVFWVDSLPDYGSEEGHREDITLVRGPVASVRVSQYFDLAFKLAKTMLEHYTGVGAVSYTGLASDIEKAKTCEELLQIARKRQINPNGFLVSTQVPASVALSGSSSSSSGSTTAAEDRLDGTVLVLTEDQNGRIVFALSMASTPARTSAYGLQMDHFLMLLQQEVQRTGLGKLSDLDPVLSAILSLVYYFYNLTPLTRGSSVVAYAVALGLVMSLGRQVSGKIPAGKLLDLEAMLSGAPDAFIAVMRQWMNVKKSAVPVSSLPKVWETMPTIRNILEVLAANTTAVCG